MQILNRIPTTEAVYNDPKFIDLLEDHLGFLRSMPTVTTIAANEQQSYKYEGDLYGLFAELNVQQQYHYIVMRVNGYSSSEEYRGDRLSFIMPDISEVKLLERIYATKS